jgi:arylsulfatase A-like enzyme
LRLSTTICLVFACGCGRQRAADAAPPAHPASLLVVTLDTVRADVVPGFGGDAERLPELAAWVAEGTRFTRAYTVAPFTEPSHASIFTGQLPTHHGIHQLEVRGQPPPPIETLAVAAARRGFRTGAFVGASFLSANGLLAAGFGRFDRPLDRPTRGARAVIDAALRWLAEVRGEAPVFLWVHLFDPHFPYDPATPQWRRCPVAARDAALRVARTPETNSCAPTGIGAQAATWWAPCLYDLYESKTMEMDAALGDLRRAMQARGPFTWALVADHGECLGEEGRYAQHADTLLECAVHIPLTLGGAPELPPGLARDELVSSIDVAPTLAAAAGLPLIEADGRSLLSPSLPPRAAAFEAAGISMPGCLEPALGAWLTDEKVVWLPNEGRWRAWRRIATEVVEVPWTTLSPAGERLGRELSWAPPLPPPEGHPGGIPADQQATLRALGYLLE